MSQGAPPWVSASWLIGAALRIGRTVPRGAMDDSLPTGRGVSEAVGEHGGGRACDEDRAPVSRRGYTGVARTSESPTRGTFRSFVAAFDGGTERDNVQYFLPFFPLSFLCFLPPLSGWHSDAPWSEAPQVEQVCLYLHDLLEQRPLL